MFDLENELYDHIVSGSRESETEKDHDKREMMGESEYERNMEDLWHDIWSSVRAARRYGMSEREITRAINED